MLIIKHRQRNAAKDFILNPYKTSKTKAEIAKTKEMIGEFRDSKSSCIVRIGSVADSNGMSYASFIDSSIVFKTISCWLAAKTQKGFSFHQSQMRRGVLIMTRGQDDMGKYAKINLYDSSSHCGDLDDGLTLYCDVEKYRKGGVASAIDDYLKGIIKDFGSLLKENGFSVMEQNEKARISFKGRFYERDNDGDRHGFLFSKNAFDMDSVMLAIPNELLGSVFTINSYLSCQSGNGLEKNAFVNGFIIIDETAFSTYESRFSNSRKIVHPYSIQFLINGDPDALLSMIESNPAIKNVAPSKVEESLLIKELEN